MANKTRINATRMQLLQQKRKLVLAKKGHKLLKDKLDGLIQQILSIVKSYQRLSSLLEQKLIDIFQKLSMASAQINQEALYSAILASKASASVNVTIKNIMGVKIPKYELISEGDPITYSFADTPAELDLALKEFMEILKDLVELAEKNKAIEVIASTIIEIKRRVNALEYILIPEVAGNVRYIRMRLSEMERENIVSLMKIKDIVRAR